MGRRRPPLLTPSPLPTLPLSFFQDAGGKPPHLLFEWLRLILPMVPGRHGRCYLHDPEPCDCNCRRQRDEVQGPLDHHDARHHGNPSLILLNLLTLLCRRATTSHPPHRSPCDLFRTFSAGGCNVALTSPAPLLLLLRFCPTLPSSSASLCLLQLANLRAMASQSTEQPSASSSA
jgi:hypothetical protein